MSSILVESPNPSSQLYFSWVGQADPEHTEFRPRANFKSKLPETAVPINHGSRIQLAKSQQTEARITPEKKTCVTNARMAQPAKMGSMMIKLLKRYGISDAEIAAGISNYAAANS